MENNEFLSDPVELSLPVNAAYVSAARLTASSIANRMSFDIDEIEDIKSAVSEACAFLIKYLPNDSKAMVKIRFTLEGSRLLISFNLRTTETFAYDSDEMGIMMIKGLMDSFDTAADDTGNFTMKIGKAHKEISFD